MSGTLHHTEIGFCIDTCKPRRRKTEISIVPDVTIGGRVVSGKVGRRETRGRVALNIRHYPLDYRLFGRGSGRFHKFDRHSRNFCPAISPASRVHHVTGIAVKAEERKIRNDRVSDFFRYYFIIIFATSGAAHHRSVARWSLTRARDCSAFRQFRHDREREAR